MGDKLTLRIDEKLIVKAKRIAKRSGKSVSKMIADYFKTLDEKTLNEANLPPITKSLQGIIKKTNIHKEDYKKYLEDKYL
ncbi:DUF6364 family protein [Desulfobacterota bacterium AH_259_B03_O07]|nr:DUF6364 family protein [Desulfobacterota bacterium AH_259_B03_O07]